MSDTIIKVEGLGKKYTISHEGQEKYTALRDVIARKTKSVFSKSNKSDSKEEFWALKDVNFEINQGEAVGIVGKNGAGKSTLLKILSRITEPSKGKIEIGGRVASLLEVGTGFHPELTGRENIFLNGAILGMSRAEIKRKFDEIVDFSGVDRFLDTPVKRYSSGMYVRLAFAVAAHLEPEILVVDEVLAVGDADFQKKCLGKMNEVSKKEGRTVLFVSHNMGAVQTLCNKAVFLEAGSVKRISNDVKSIINDYLNGESQVRPIWNILNEKRFEKNNHFMPHKMYLCDNDFTTIERYVSNDEQIGLAIEGELLENNNMLTVGFALYNEENSLLYWSLTTDQPESGWPKLQVGYNKLICWLPKHFLNEGKYSIHLIVSIHFVKWIYEPLINAPSINFTIQGGLSQSPYWHSARPGLTAPILKFQTF